MDFEEFKSYQEKFTAIDTPEKLSRIRRMYDGWLLMEEDSKYLEPVENELGDAFPSKEYFRIIESTFNPLLLRNGELNVLVLPSFKREYQLNFNSERVTLTFVNDQLWSDFYQGNKLNSKTKTRTLATKTNERLTVIEEAKKLIRTARKPKGTLGTLDGVLCYFIYKEANNIQIAFKNPSDDDSPVSTLINRIDKIIGDKSDVQHIL
jgi:competence protein ComGF